MSERLPLTLKKLFVIVEVMRYLLLLLLLLPGCLTPNPRAAMRQRAAFHLADCLNIAPDFPSRKTLCLDLSAAECRSMGLENGCGIDDLWNGRQR